MRPYAGLPIPAAAALGGPLAGSQPPERPTFRGGVARVSLAATVRDSRGRPVTNLTATDFDLFDNGQRREILDFSRAEAPVALGLLADVSGSMNVAAKRAAALETAKLLVQVLGKEDRVGLFAFDRVIDEVAAVGTTPDELLKRLSRI